MYKCLHLAIHRPMLNHKLPPVGSGTPRKGRIKERVDWWNAPKLENSHVHILVRAEKPRKLIYDTLLENKGS